MTRHAEKHLLEKFAAGSSEAFLALVERKRAIVRRFVESGMPPGCDVDAYERHVFSRALSELGKLDPEQDDLTIHLLESLRDHAFEQLSHADYSTSLFASGRDVYSTVPRVPSLPVKVLSGEEDCELEPWRAALDERQLLLLELVFLEAAPIRGAGELVNCSANILQSFVFNVLDGMGELSHLSHRDECPPDLFLGMEVVRHRGSKQKVAKLKEQHAGCAGCQELLDRTALMVTLWGKDWRDAPAGTGAFVDRLLSSAGRSVTRPPEPAVTVVELSAPPAARRSRLPGLLAFGAMLVAFVSASVSYLVKDVPPPLPALSGGNRLAEVKRRPPERLGTLSSASAAAEPLYDGSDVATDLRNPATLAYDSGTEVELAPGGAGRTQTGGFTLVNGQARVTVPEGRDQPFRVVSGDVSAQSPGGELVVFRTPGRQTVLAVERGSAVLHLPDGRELPLDPGRQATIDLETGQSTIADYDPSDLSNLAAGSGTSRASGSGPSFDAGPKEGDTSAPPRSPLEGGGLRPSEVRGFRDSF